MVTMLQPDLRITNLDVCQPPQPARGDESIVEVITAVDLPSSEISPLFFLTLRLGIKLMVSADQPEIVQIHSDGGVVTHPGLWGGMLAAVVVAQENCVGSLDKRAIQPDCLVNLPAVTVEILLM